MNTKLKTIKEKLKDYLEIEAALSIEKDTSECIVVSGYGYKPYKKLQSMLGESAAYSFEMKKNYFSVSIYFKELLVKCLEYYSEMLEKSEELYIENDYDPVEREERNKKNLESWRN